VENKIEKNKIMNLKEKYPHLTKANVEWILEVAYPISKLRITEDHLGKVLRAKSLILNHPVEIVSCYSCGARSYWKVSQSVIEQHLDNLKQLLIELTELETAEFSQTFYYVDGHVESISNNANLDEIPTNIDEISDDIIVEKIVSMESTENEISVTTVKRGRKKNEE